MILGQGNDGGDADRAAGSVSGTVSTEDGDPIENAPVVLISVMNDHRRPDMYRAETNADGEFNFEHVVVGNYLITAGALRHGVAEEEIEVIADEDTFVELVIGRDEDDEPDEVGGVAGTVSDTDGEPISRAEIRLMGGMNDHNQHRFQARTISDEHGEYSFEDVPAGVLLLSAGKIGFIPFAHEIEVIADEVLEANIVLEAFHHDDVEFGSVSGNVVDEEGNPIDHANIILIPERGDNDRGNPGGGWDRPLVAFTDEDGNYGIHEVPVGNYIAPATKLGHGMADEHIEVAVEMKTLK